MIRFFLLQNRQGKTRLSKWYVAAEESDKRKIEGEVHRLVTSRDSKFTNFVEVRDSFAGASATLGSAGRAGPWPQHPESLTPLSPSPISLSPL